MQVLDKSIKTQAIFVPADSIQLPEEFIAAQRYLVYNDSVLIVRNRTVKSHPLLQCYNLRSRKPIADLFLFGNGPGEMLKLTARLQGNILVADDHMKRQVAFLDMDSLLLDTNYKPKMRKYQAMPHRICPYRGDSMLFDNPYCFENKRLGIKNKVARLAAGNEQTTDQELLGQNEYYTYNVTGGEILVSPEKDRIVFTSDNYPLIEFYDYDLNLLHTVTGPDSFENQLYTVYQDTGSPMKEVVFKKTIPHTYVTSCSDDQHIFLAYLGVQTLDAEKVSPYIFQFDWDGRLIGSYRTDHHLLNMSLSLDGKTIYATGFDDYMQPVLYSLRLP